MHGAQCSVNAELAERKPRGKSESLTSKVSSGGPISLSKKHESNQGHLLSLVLKGEVEEEIVFFLLPDAFMSACETPGYLADS